MTRRRSDAGERGEGTDRIGEKGRK